MFVFVLGAAAACASVLGYEKDYELAPDAASESGGRNDGASEATDTDSGTLEAGVPDVVETDAPPVDAGPDSGAGEADADSAPPPSFVGVPCGTENCAPGTVCCFRNLVIRLGCMLAPDCAMMAGNPVACDGDEDCPNEVCCANAANFAAAFAVTCATLTSCASNGVPACHIGTGTCDCMRTAGCLPVTTCGGRCQ
jgi:hypothetical protein